MSSSTYLSIITICLLLFGCSETSHLKELELDCNPQQTKCAVSVGDAVLSLQTRQPSLPALQPLTFDFEIASERDVEVGEPQKLWFEGRDMYMGEHFLEVSERVSSMGGSKFKMTGMIPVCMTGSDMVWKLRFELPLNDQRYLIYANLKPKPRS